MNRIFTFNETARGSLHIQRGKPCQDCSDSFSAESGKFHVAVIADGHGAKECYRSDRGARFAVETAMQNLIDFANAVLVSEESENCFYQDIFTNPRYRKMTVRHLTDTIIAQWNDRVIDDYKTDMPTMEEAGEYAETYDSESTCAHIYGTTLMAGLLLPKCLILLHQGDGRCDVFYEDGSVDQPIPWDSRCEDNITTSLCDEDAADGIRSCVLNLEKKPIAACYLGCDGIEDSYRDTYESFGGTHEVMGGVHTFYKDLTCQIASMESGEFLNYIKNMLPEFSAIGRFSRCGSGDDVSVAGFVDLEAIRPLKEPFAMDVERYSLEEELFWKEDELRSKIRKHSILLKRMNDAKEKVDFLNMELQKNQQIQQDLLADVESAQKVYEESKAAFEEYDSEYQKIDAERQKIADAIQKLH